MTTYLNVKFPALFISGDMKRVGHKRSPFPLKNSMLTFRWSLKSNSRSPKDNPS